VRQPRPGRPVGIHPGSVRSSPDTTSCRPSRSPTSGTGTRSPAPVSPPASWNTRPGARSRRRSRTRTASGPVHPRHRQLHHRRHLPAHRRPARHRMHPNRQIPAPRQL